MIDGKMKYVDAKGYFVGRFFRNGSCKRNRQNGGEYRKNCYRPKVYEHRRNTEMQKTGRY